MINKLVIGTVQFGLDYGITNRKGKISEEELNKVFNICNEKNIMYFDTAQDYGNSEDILVNYKKIYNKIKIITKAKFKNKNINETIEKSICKFDIIDYFLLHSFDDYNEDVINKLIEYKINKKINKIGVSVYTVNEAIICLKNEHIDVVQIPFNYSDSQWLNSDFINLINDTTKEIHIRSIFLQGVLLNPILKRPINILEYDFDKLNNKIDYLTNLLQLSRLELCFAYINSFQWITKFLIGIDDYDHLMTNYEIINKNLKLTDEQLNIVHETMNDINPLITNPSKWIF